MLDLSPPASRVFFERDCFASVGHASIAVHVTHVAAIAHAISAIRLIHFIGKVLELLQSLSIVELLGQNLRSQLLKLDPHLF